MRSSCDCTAYRLRVSTAGTWNRGVSRMCTGWNWQSGRVCTNIQSCCAKKMVYARFCELLHKLNFIRSKKRPCNLKTSETTPGQHCLTSLPDWEPVASAQLKRTYVRCNTRNSPSRYRIFDPHHQDMGVCKPMTVRGDRNPSGHRSTTERWNIQWFNQSKLWKKRNMQWQKRTHALAQ